MNKLTKGTIAGAAGIVLLLGGAGTFALWSDSASVPGGEINTGTLSFVEGTGAWNDISTDVANTPVFIPTAELPTYLIVPGDKLEYSNDLTIDATGENLMANFGYTWTAPLDLPPDVTVVVSVAGPAGPVAAGTPVVVADGDVYDVTVTVEYVLTAADQNVGQGETINISDIALTLTQVRPLP